MDTLLLVRHGEAEHHVREITGGWTDTCLTERGREQASRLALRLKLNLDVTHLYCSDDCFPELFE